MSWEITGTISWIEVIWTVICGIGLLFGAKLVASASRDLMALRAKRINSIREYAAIVTILAFFIPTFMELGFVGVGIVAMTAPNQPGAPSTQSIVIFVVFITLSCFKAGMLVLVERMRNRLIRMISRIEMGLR